MTYAPSKLTLGLLGLCLFFGQVASAPAAQIYGGSAAITFLEGKGAAISEFDAYFNEATTRAQTLSLAAPGNAPFTETAANVQLVDPIRPSGVIPAGYPGVPGGSRSPQLTTLVIENTSNVLGSWTSSNDAFAFVGNSTLGEQIALTSMTRWTGPFTGALVYGDFAIRYVPSRATGGNSGLVLTSNIDFLHAAFADIANASIGVIGTTLSITGDLRISGGLFVLDGTSIPGTNFGTINLTANLAPVPEPSSIVLASLGGLGLLTVAQRRRRRHGA